MTLIQRSMASAERSFHKSLAVLAKLQKARGFVPQKAVSEEITAGEAGFVPAESPEDAAEKSRSAGFVPQKKASELEAFKYMGYFPEDHDEYVESIANSGNYLSDNTENATRTLVE